MNTLFFVKSLCIVISKFCFRNLVNIWIDHKINELSKRNKKSKCCQIEYPSHKCTVYSKNWTKYCYHKMSIFLINIHQTKVLAGNRVSQSFETFLSLYKFNSKNKVIVFQIWKVSHSKYNEVISIRVWYLWTDEIKKILKANTTTTFTVE